MKKKNIIALTAALVIAGLASHATAQKEGEETKTAWFDMGKCEICQHMADHMELMSQIKWETHLIDNGFLSVSVIPDSAKATMKKAKSGMDKEIAKFEKGAKMDLCGYCNGMGELIAAGAKKKEIETVGGNIFMLTSSDPAVVKKIHAHAKKTMDEYEKMQKMMKAGGEHPSYDHKEHKGEHKSKAKAGK